MGNFYAEIYPTNPTQAESLDTTGFAQGGFKIYTLPNPYFQTLPITLNQLLSSVTISDPKKPSFPILGNVSLFRGMVGLKLKG